MGRSAISTATAEVAEFVLAKEARHVVAPLGLLDLCSAHRTEDDRIDALVPSFECFLHGLLTAGAVTMPIFSAPEAHSVGALRTG